MDHEKRKEFIQRWGSLAVGWGVSKTMGQIQALLLTYSEPLSSQHIKEKLDISVGSVNKATRELVEWGLIHKTSIQGCRKDYFVAEKDVLQMFRVVVEHRMQRELKPMVELLEDYTNDNSNDQSNDFVNTLGSFLQFSYAAQEALLNLTTCNPKWIFNSYAKKKSDVK